MREGGGLRLGIDDVAHEGTRQEPVAHLQRVGSMKIKPQILGERVNHLVEASRHSPHQMTVCVEGGDQVVGPIREPYMARSGCHCLETDTAQCRNPFSERLLKVQFAPHCCRRDRRDLSGSVGGHKSCKKVNAFISSQRRVNVENY